MADLKAAVPALPQVNADFSNAPTPSPNHDQPPNSIPSYVAESFQPKGCYTREFDDTTDTTDSESGLAGTNLTDEGAVPTPLASVEFPLFRLEAFEGVPIEADIDECDVRLLHKAHHQDPFSVLGAHFFQYPGIEEPCIVVRVWRKDVREVQIRPLREHLFQADSSSPDGWLACHQRSHWLFQLAFRVSVTDAGSQTISQTINQAEKGGQTISQTISETEKGSISQAISQGSPKLNEKKGGLAEAIRTSPFYYEVRVKYYDSGPDYWHEIRDAFNFGLIIPSFDLRLFQAGSCWHVDSLMGSHVMEVNRALGVRFAVWAPNAQFVSVVGDWNQWDGRAHPMRKRFEFGVWELFIPNIQAGERYGYRIHSRSGVDSIKIDPYAQQFEVPPKTASIISGCDDAFKPSAERFQWRDEVWMEQRKKLAKTNELSRKPMSIYEVHLPSWMRGDGNRHLSYHELAHRLVEHIKQLGFTHVEFLPLAHHPFEGSWGYQVSGQYAPYSRLGSPDDLKYLINELHRNDIGVFLDFVPAHFVKDTWGLVRYDGTPCYEYADPREGEHKGWGTLVYNFRRNEVRSYLLGAAYHWLRRYHIDGLRIDAVSSMIYKNHCREPGDWLPNEYGGDANLQAISLLQELNWVVHREFPGVFTMAEESTSWQGVTDKEKGLGFDAKWDLGWMNDTLSYLCTPAPERWKKHQKLTFRGLYLAHEKWVLPLSHDEVVSGKGSLLDKCGFAGAPFEERLCTLRALYGFQVCMPGRPLIFMGGEFAQGREWKESQSVDWHEAEEPARAKMMLWLADLLHTYKSEKALHAGDDEIWNFQWVDCDNAKDNVIGWIRKYNEWHEDVLVVVNFSGRKYARYPFGVPHGGKWKTLLNSDDWKYGGNMTGSGPGVLVEPTVGGRLGWPYCLWLDVPPFSCLVFKAPEPSGEEGSGEAVGVPVPEAVPEAALNANEGTVREPGSEQL